MSQPAIEHDPLSALSDAHGAAIVTIDTDGVVRYANRGLEKMFGFPIEEVVGRNVTVLMGEPHEDEHDGHIVRHQSTGEARIIGIGRNVRGRRADGSTFPIHLAVEEIEAPQFKGYLGIMTDQSALEVSAPRMMAAVDMLSEGLALFDEHERLVLSNERYRHILGLSRDAVAPGTMFDDQMATIGASDGPLARGALRRAGSGPESEHRTFSGQRSILIRLMRLNTGDAILALRDETEATRRADAMARAERLRALGELTGGVAHDFNNLLAVVIGNLELLEGRLTNSEARAIVGEALEAAEIGARLTDRLLAFARRQPLVAQEIDVNAMITEVGAILERTLGSNITLFFDLDPRGPKVKADRGGLESGLINLAANARDAMPDGGRCCIETRGVVLDRDDLADVVAGSFVVISVSDTGIGMTSEVAARVFEPFFTTKEKGRGSGLGLSSLYGFAKQSGGELTVYSEVGQGSVFNLYLPSVEDLPEIREPERDLTSRLASKVILVVDDDDRVRRSSVKHVEALGARALEANSGEEALAIAAARNDVDCVFTDIVMPGGIDGFALVKRLRETSPSLPILLTTGFAEQVLERDPDAVHGLVVLRKPFRQRDLKAALLRVLSPAE